MAVTSIWAVKGRVDKVINYAINPDKTRTEDNEYASGFHALDQVIQYAADDMKTEERLYVTGVNCIYEKAVEEFMKTKNDHNKLGGITAFHGYQSFAKGETDAETAHEIGVKLAKRLWGERFQVVVATHCNTGCFHNHFVVNSVSDIDGGKFNACKTSYRQMREESDRLCEEYGLSVIYEPKIGHIPYNAWKAEQDGKLTRFDLYRRDIDAAIMGASTITEFVKRMSEMNYEVVLQGKYARFREIGREKFHRFYKLGEDYTLDAIKERILNDWRSESPFDKSEVEAPDYESQDEQVYRSNIPLLFVHYNFELTFYYSHPYALRRVHPALREDAKNMERISKQTVFLGKTKIKTMEDLEAFQAESEAEINMLISRRQELKNQIKRETRAGDDASVDKTKADISALSLRLKEMRGEVNLCKQIAERSSSMTECIMYMINEREIERKEKNRNEPIQRSSGTDRANEFKRRGSRSETDRQGFFETGGRPHQRDEHQ